MNDHDQDLRVLRQAFAEHLREIAGILREACGIKPLDADELTRLSELDVQVLRGITPEQLAEYDALKHRHLDARAMAKHVRSLMQPQSVEATETGLSDPRTREAGDLAWQAEKAARAHDFDTARALYARAAELEEAIAEAAINHHPHVLSMLAVSAVALWHKAGNQSKVDALARRWLAENKLTEHERRELQDMIEVRYFILDTSRVAGDCAVWWGPDGKGYTSDLAKAGTFSREYIDTHRIVDFPVRVDVARSVAVMHVRIDHLRRTGVLAELDQRAADEVSDDDEPGVDVDYPHDCDLDAVR